MATTLTGKVWEGTDREALNSLVAQMQIVQQQGRSPMRGMRINEGEALSLRASAFGISTTIDCDFSDKFERVDAVLVYNSRLAAYQIDTNAVTTAGQQNPAKVTITVTATQANDILLMTVIGKLLPGA